jgi:PAS domain S-box-containing protein
MALKKEITAKIRDLLRQNPQGLNITAIVRSININRNTAGRYLENLMVSGQVEMRQFGMAKVYRLARRVPLSAMLSISSELIMLLDKSMRVIYANDPLLQFCGTTQEEFYGKNIEYTPCVTVFDDAFDSLKKQIRAGISGKEWYGELPLQQNGVVFACRIAPAVFEEGQLGVSVLLDDITGRKQAEQAQKESEERYRSFVQNFHGIAYRGRMDFVPVFFHGAVEEITGYTEKDFLEGKPRWDQVIHPDDLRELQKSFFDLRTCPPKSTEREYRIVRRDGGVRWIHEHIQNICDDSGRPAFVQGALYDVSDRKNAEDALRESEATARALINTPTDSILLLDAHGIILDLNETAAHRMGRRKEELIGALIDTILPKDIARARRSIVSRVVECKTAVRFEDERNGIWFDTVAYPVTDEAGEVKKVAIIARDITDRIRTEEALRQSEGKLHAMLQSITDPMSMMDENLTIIWANDPARRYFGAGIVGRKCYEAFHQRQEPCEPSPCLTLMAFGDGKMHRHETTVIDREGTRRFFDCTANVAIRDEQGRPAAVLEISRDCTGLKRAKEALDKGTGEVRDTGAPGVRTKKAPSLN